MGRPSNLLFPILEVGLRFLEKRNKLKKEQEKNFFSRSVSFKLFLGVRKKKGAIINEQEKI